MLISEINMFVTHYATAIIKHLFDSKVTKQLAGREIIVLSQKFLL